MMPSRMRLSATSATEQKIPFARMYQAIASFSNFAFEDFVPEQKRVDADNENNQGGRHGD